VRGNAQRNGHPLGGSVQCCCQGLTSRGQEQGLEVRGRGRGQGQGLKFQILKHLLNNNINFLE